MKAVYAGTFSPITNGHLAVIEPCLDLFDELVIGIGQNPKKNPLFTEEERQAMIEESIKELGVGDGSNWKVSIFPYMFLVDYAHEIGASFYVRGLRDQGDFVDERRYASANMRIRPDITPIWIPTPMEFSDISSSGVLGMCGIKGWEERVRELVPGPVFKRLLDKFNK
jgi:pantetheine-phosphate adenylyltransferase